MFSSQYLRTLDIFCDWGWEIDQALFAWFIQSHSFRWNKSIRSILNHYKSKNLFFLQKLEPQLLCWMHMKNTKFETVVERCSARYSEKIHILSKIKENTCAWVTSFSEVYRLQDSNLTKEQALAQMFLVKFATFQMLRLRHFDTIRLVF